MTSVTSPEQTRHKLPIRTLIAASVGNAVEWYDWTVFATFSIYFATQIFSDANESAAFIGTFATYAVAFFFRPLGGMLLGRYADLRGRKQAMLLTIALMAGGSFVIAILPTFDQVGWLAPILLLVARIAQGMSLGGEVSNASAYLAEIAPPERRGRYSSFFYISTGTAVLLASLLGALLASTLSDDQLAALGLAGAVLHRRPARPRRGLAAQGHGRDRAVRGEQGQGAGDQEPADDDAARAPARGGAADGLHAALDALLLHVLLGADAVRGQAAGARRRHGLLGAVHRDRAVRRAAVPLRLDRRPVRPQAADADLGRADRASASCRCRS